MVVKLNLEKGVMEMVKLEEAAASWLFGGWLVEDGQACRMSARYIFTPPQPDQWKLIEQNSYAGCLQAAREIAYENGAMLLEVRSLEDMSYSAIGIMDASFHRAKNGEAAIKGSWYIQERHNDLSYGEGYALLIPPASFAQKAGGKESVNGYWFSSAFVFGDEIGSAISLANMRYLKRLAGEYDLAFTPMIFFELLNIKPGEDFPPLVLCRDLFGTYGVLFHEQTLSEKYPEFWQKVRQVKPGEILDSPLLLETERVMAGLGRRFTSSLIEVEFGLVEVSFKWRGKLGKMVEVE